MKNILFNENGIVTDNIVNELAENDVSKLVSVCEKRYDDQLESVCKTLMDNENYKIVLLAGPSGSGKNTTAGKLAEKIKR